tara:strand:- start:2 stop:712 length:711 start_codon:yes stop_codon:yes gene_type:complete
MYFLKNFYIIYKYKYKYNKIYIYIMIEQDYILIILNCYKYREKAILQKNTWLKTLPNNIKYFHIIGDIDKCNGQNFLFDNDESILYVNTKDDYNSLPSKVIYALDAINSTYKYKYIFKTDDDQKLVYNNFFELLTVQLSKSIEVHYGGYILNVNDHISNYHTVHDCLPRDLLLKKCTYCNGRFYFLSPLVVSNLIEHKNDICSHIIEDHAIGLYIDDKYKKNMLFMNSQQFFKDSI